MILKKWEDLPGDMRNGEVREYYDILAGRKGRLILKRLFDIIFSLLLLVIFAVPMIIISICIISDSSGTVMFRQKRVTSYGRIFRIHKFRTMVSGADRMGSQVTAGRDSRITKAGAFLRKYRLDEIPQLFDVLAGNMSFVGTRPEVPEYVDKYTAEMKATLLMPAGITSEASIRYKDEAMLLEGADDVDRVYVETVLPEKMKYNLGSIRDFSLTNDLKIMLRTAAAVLK